MDIAEWSSLVARRAHNPKVVGSNPASATTRKADKIAEMASLSAFFHILPFIRNRACAVENAPKTAEIQTKSHEESHEIPCGHTRITRKITRKRSVESGMDYICDRRGEK